MLAAIYVVYILLKWAALAVSEAASWARAYMHLAEHIPLATAAAILLINGLGQAQRLWRNDDARHR